MYQRILVPTDGSDVTTKAIATAVSLAKALGSKVEALSVKEPFPYSAISEIQVCGGITTNMPNRITGSRRRTRSRVNRAGPSLPIRNRQATPEMRNKSGIRQVLNESSQGSTPGASRGLFMGKSQDT